MKRVGMHHACDTELRNVLDVDVEHGQVTPQGRLRGRCGTTPAQSPGSRRHAGTRCARLRRQPPRQAIGRVNAVESAGVFGRQTKNTPGADGANIVITRLLTSSPSSQCQAASDCSAPRMSRLMATRRHHRLGRPLLRLRGAQPLVIAIAEPCQRARHSRNPARTRDIQCLVTSGSRPLIRTTAPVIPHRPVVQRNRRRGEPVTGSRPATVRWSCQRNSKNTGVKSRTALEHHLGTTEPVDADGGLAQVTNTTRRGSCQLNEGMRRPQPFSSAPRTVIGDDARAAGEKRDQGPGENSYRGAVHG